MNDVTASEQIAAARAASSGLRGLALIAFAFVATMLGGALPTPLYPAYERRFGFGPLTVTIVFAMYAVGTLGALLLIGRASDTIGRRPVLFGGVAAGALSSLLFVVAGSVSGDAGLVLLYPARVLSGASAGIFTGTATAAIADLAGAKRARMASVVAAIASMGGLGLGPLVCGLLARYVADPLRTPYWLHVGLLAAAAVAIALVAEPVAVQRPRRWHFQAPTVPAEGRGVFIEAGTASFAGFALLGMFTSVCPAMLALLGHHNPAVTGAVVFVAFAGSVLGQVGSVALSPSAALLGGTAGLVAGLVLVGSSLAATSLALLIVGAAVGGIAQGAGFRSALGLVTGISPPDQRGSVASSFFALSYIGLSLPVIGIGIGTRAYGLVHTGEVFTAVLAVLTLGALASLARRLRQP
jgi:MFS family permease